MGVNRWIRTTARGTAAVLIVALAGQVPALPASAAASDPPVPQVTTSVPGGDLPGGTPPADRLPALRQAAGASWPAPGTIDLDLPGATPGGPAALAQAGTSPVWLGRAASDPAVLRARVAVLDRASVARTGRDGLLLRIGRLDGGRTAGAVRLRVDYTAFRSAYGGDWAGRLQLVALPGCALSTPDRPQCTGTVVPSRIDRTAGTISGDVSASPLNLSAPADSAGQLVLLTASSGSDGGDYAATTLAATATWQAGGSSGDFTWSYPMRMPPGLGGPVPAVSLSYSAQSVDGRTAATNNQPSWVGEGFEFSAGSIERSYKSCNDDGVTGVGDLCWGGDSTGFGDNATLTMSGHGGELIADGQVAGRWHLRDDDGTKVEKLSGAANGDGGSTVDGAGEYWKETTTDGTQYFFGRNRLPGWTTGKPETNSTWTAPVYGNGGNEPCHATAFTDSQCTQAYRWNLDYVVDPHGNTMSVWYTKETNNYARNHTDGTVSTYVRAGYPSRVDYGTRLDATGTDTGYSKPAAPMQVTFTPVGRCITPGATCVPSNPSNWPDVPWDQNCTSTTSCPGKYAPTFWATQMLSQVTTRVWNSTGYQDVERWTLNHEFKDPGNQHQAVLWLKTISHAGLLTSPATTVPEAILNPVQMNNRVDVDASTDPIIRYRLANVTSETGAVTSVTYSGPDCTLGSRMPASADNNSLRCFPAYWYPPLSSTLKLGWFQKYVVTDVTVADVNNASPTEAWSYQYPNPSGKALWHHDDVELTPPSRRSWGQWRGYEKVRVLHGTAPEPRTQTDALYFRGMDGDLLSSGVRTVSVTDSTGVALPDSPWRQGMLREQITYNGVGDTAPHVSKTIHDPWEHGPTATRTRNGVTVTAYATDIKAVRTRAALDGGRPDRTTTATNTFDFDDGTANPIGRVTMVDDAGDDATTADDKCTRTSYATNPATWVLAAVAEVETVAVKCATVPDRTVDVISDERRWYDGAASFDRTVSKGDVTRIEKLADWNGGNPIYIQQARARYDDYGRVLDSFDALDRKTSTVYTPAADAPVTGTTVTNPLGWQTTSTVLPWWGATVRLVDPNGRRVDQTFDGLGRATAVWLPGRDKDAQQTANKTFSYTVRNSNGPTAVGTSVLNNSGTGYNTSYAIYDGQLRLRQTQSPGANGVGRIIVDTRYNTQGQTVRVTNPFWNNNSVGTALFGYLDTDLPGYTVTAYDGAGRPARSTLMSAGVEKWHSTVGYGGDRVDKTPPAGGIATATVTDARGRVIQLRQHHGGVPSGAYDHTDYSYNPAGQLATLSDPAGNAWRYGYDQLGRKTSDRDPDKGTTAYTYDNADQLTSTTDSRGITLVYKYDALGRKTEEYRDSSSTGPRLAAWTYDTLLRGQPTSSTRFDANGNAYTTATTGYDAAYRVTGTSVTIPANEGALAGTYTFATTYNPDGTPATATLPGGGGLSPETLQYTYNLLGLPLTLGGLGTYATSTSYTDLGQQSVLYLADGGGHILRQYWYFDTATARLTRHVAYTDTTPHYHQDANYSYDPAGNVTDIADQLATHGEGLADDNQCFRYDYLTRLTEAWTPATNDCTTNPTVAALGGPAPYWQSFTYDLTGNRATRVDHGATGDTIRTGTYPAAGANQPHTLTALATAGPGLNRADSYTYDPAGNTLTRPGSTASQTLTWDAEGHLATVAEGSQTASYVYDANGARLIGHDATGATLHLGNVEYHAGTGGTVTATRYYQHGGQVVAVRTTAGLTWQTNDQQGTGQLSFTSTALAKTQRRTMPFGELRGGDPAWPSPHGFVNGVRDPTSLVHLGAREYDPVTGRFVSVDPVLDTADPQQMNGYSYATNSPVTLSDPDGRWAKDPKESGNPTPAPSPTPPRCTGSEHSGGCGHAAHDPAPSVRRGVVSAIVHAVISALRAAVTTPPASLLALPDRSPDYIVFEGTTTVMIEQPIYADRTVTKIMYRTECRLGVCFTVLHPVQVHERVQVGVRREKRTITDGFIITRDGSLFEFEGDVYTPGQDDEGGSSYSIRAGWLLPRDQHTPTPQEVNNFVGGGCIGYTQSNKGIAISHVVSSPALRNWSIEVGYTSGRSAGASIAYTNSFLINDHFADPWPPKRNPNTW